jgi:hypothetical protein
MEEPSGGTRLPDLGNRMGGERQAASKHGADQRVPG